MDTQQRYGTLLGALSATFVLDGVAEPGGAQRIIGTILIGATLVLALYAAQIGARSVRIAAATLVGAVVVGVIVAEVVGSGSTAVAFAAIANGLLVAFTPPAVVVGIGRNLRATGTVTLTVVFGVLCLYMLAGLFFAFVYVAMQNLGGAPFFSSGAAAISSRAVYFSFVTLTTVGYGDFTARTNLGHTLAVIEALLGQIYLVTVVAAIVGNLAPRGRAAP